MLQSKAILLVLSFSSLSSAAQKEGEAQASPRFPRYGSKEHRGRCSWVYSYHSSSPYNCTFYITPIPGSGEGLAQWISMVATGYVYAAQVNCRLVVDYGPSVDLEQIFVQPERINSDTSNDLSWQVDSNFTCEESQGCYNIGSNTIGGIEEQTLRQIAKRHYPEQLEIIRKKQFGKVPYYRSAYSRAENETTAMQYLTEAMPGFEYSDGFACAITSLFELGESAEHFIPGLFDDVLKTLLLPESLVITLYIRTGRTDRMADKERGIALADNTEESINSGDDPDVMHLINCAKNLEEKKLIAGVYSDIVWLVISGDANVAHKVADDHSVPIDYNGQQKQTRRKVITTNAQGVQSRPARNPSTAEFADALLDW